MQEMQKVYTKNNLILKSQKKRESKSKHNNFGIYVWPKKNATLLALKFKEKHFQKEIFSTHSFRILGGRWVGWPKPDPVWYICSGFQWSWLMHSVHRQSPSGMCQCLWVALTLTLTVGIICHHQKQLTVTAASQK